MDTKIKTILFVLVASFILLGCGQKQSITDNFTQYDSTDFIKENDLSDRIPVFSVKYPPEWEYGWFSDSGVIALLISSGDVNAAWSLQDTSGATMMIAPFPYSGEKLTDLFFFASDKGLEPSTTTINGQEAARIEYTDDGQLRIEVVIVREKWALSVVTFFPAEKDAEFRSLIDGIIGTIEIK